MSKSPAFQLYAGDFLTDVMDWTDEQVGAHCRLLFWSWANRCGIPKDPARLAMISRKAKKSWDVIGTKWVDGPGDTWVNLRLEKTRAESDAFRDKQAAKSKLGVLARSAQPLDKPKGQPVGLPVGNPLEGEGEVSINSGKKERAKTEAVVIQMPFTSEPFALAWAAFETMRTKIRKPLTDEGRRLMMARCLGLGEVEAIRALNNSTMNSWTGIFPDKNSAGSFANASQSASPHKIHTGKL